MVVDADKHGLPSITTVAYDAGLSNVRADLRGLKT
jgi:hypothetical protein